MRVTILNQFYAPDLSATAHLCRSLAEHLAAGGAEVRMVTSRGGYVAESGAAADGSDGGVTVHRLWTPRLGKANLLFRLIDYASFYVAALARMFTLPRQDVVVTLTTPPLIGLAALAHRLLHRDVKTVLWNMDCYPDIAETTGVLRRGWPASRALEWLVRRQFRRLDHVVTLDSAMTDLLKERYAPGGDGLPFMVIPNWEPADLFPHPVTEPAHASPEKPFVVLYLGNAGYGHRFGTVLDAAERLRGRPIRFLFIGGGRRWREIADAAEARNLDNIELRGYVPKEETPSVMAAAGAALITLSNDSKGVMSPSKLHSNLAMGLPIAYVGPTGSNVDEAIAAFRCGVSVRHGGDEQLADYLCRLTDDAPLHAEVRKNARRAFETRYSDRVTLKAFERLLDKVLEPGADINRPPAAQQPSANC